MGARATIAKRGPVLLVGKADHCVRVRSSLEDAGYQCAAASDPDEVLAACGKLRPEAILFTSGGSGEHELLRRIREDEKLRHVPILGDLTSDESHPLRSLAFDDWVHTEGERGARLDSAVRARHMVEQDAALRLRVEKLLEITQAASSTLELEGIMRIAVEKISEVIHADRCSVVLVEGTPRTATVVASRELPNGPVKELDLAKYPEIRRALETRQPILVEDAERDPLMEEVRPAIGPIGVRSLLVQPLICQDDILGAIFFRMSRETGAFGREEQDFAQAVAAALANSVRNARLHTALKRKRDDMESAYVDRYRELIEANRRLKEMIRLKDEIIAIVSHDLRAPLQVLLGHGRLILETNLDGEQKFSAEAINRQGKKILDLVESLLERGKGEQARVSLEPVHLDVAQLADDAAQELGILAQEKGVSLRAEAPEPLPVLGDEVKLQQVLRNLLTNALAHAKRQVVVRAQRLMRPDGEAARVIVEDDGAGIAPDQVALVFDKYRHGPGGTGLGLAICKEFIELHGGEIWAESVPGQGCRFLFTLPMVQAVEQEPPPAPAEQGGHEPRVLLVEDEPQIASVMEEILRSRYRVEVARDGAEGLAKAKGLRPDLVVMDVFLPKLDGLDAAMALKSSPDTAEIPVILISAHQGVAEKVRALNLGAVDYLHKPFQALELLARTDRALRLRDTERELERSRTLLRRTGNDPETGLLDRYGILNRLEQEFARSRRYHRPLALVIVAIAPVAAEQIRPAASLIRQTLRSPDVVGHLGSGVFALVLPECSRESGQGVVGRLLPELEREAQVHCVTVVDDLVEAREGQIEAALDRVVAQAIGGRPA